MAVKKVSNRGQRIALISISESDAWQSCRGITSNLIAAYAQTVKADQLRHIKISTLASLHGVKDVVDELAVFKPDIIVFLDTFAIYGQVLSSLKNLHTQGLLDSFVLRFHVYGDFTLRSYQWRYWSAYLTDLKTQWVCASTKQKKLISSCLRDGGESTYLLPFPVDGVGFNFSASLRRETRAALNLGADERLILYTGRMTLQKNVLGLIEAFRNLDHAKTNYRLIFIGEFDDLGSPFQKGQLSPGAFYQHWQKSFDALPSDVQEKITIARGVTQRKLRAFYCAADIFASLSLQHDEDFGMAPAEAAIAGLPLVLTDWGGYSDNRLRGAEGHWAPVTIDEAGPHFDLADVTAAIESITSQRASIADRERRGKVIAQKLSIEVAARSLVGLNNSLSSVSNFSGFNDRVDQLARCFNGSLGVLQFDTLGKESIYGQIYENYAS